MIFIAFVILFFWVNSLSDDIIKLKVDNIKLKKRIKELEDE